VVLYFYATHEAWPQYADDPAIFSTFIADPAGDQTLASESPPAVIAFPPVDVTRISLGVRDDYFYLRVDVAGSIPKSAPKIGGDKLKKQSFNLGMDCDNNPNTGTSDGSEILFHVSFDYGLRSESPYAWCDFSSTSYDSGTRKIGGERRGGGPGYNFFVFRYKIAELGGYFPRGGAVMLHSWSEIKSTQYHHFAFDEIQSTLWTIPL